MNESARRLLTLEEVADRLRIEGKDRRRSVRELFRKYDVPIIRKKNSLVSEEQFKALVKAMTFSLSGNAVGSITSGARSVSVPRGGGSKNILRAAIAERTRKPIAFGSPVKSEPSYLTVVK